MLPSYAFQDMKVSFAGLEIIAESYAKYFIYWQLIKHIYTYLLKKEKENTWVINLAHAAAGTAEKQVL